MTNTRGGVFQVLRLSKKDNKSRAQVLMIRSDRYPIVSKDGTTRAIKESGISKDREEIEREGRKELTVEMEIVSIVSNKSRTWEEH